MENGETTTPTPGPEGKKDDPSGFLSELVDAPVIVKLNSNIIFKGFLKSVDGYMNISLERCQETFQGKPIRTWGDAFIRGNNVAFISADPEG